MLYSLYLQLEALLNGGKVHELVTKIEQLLIQEGHKNFIVSIVKNQQAIYSMGKLDGFASLGPDKIEINFK